MADPAGRLERADADRREARSQVEQVGAERRDGPTDERAANAESREQVGEERLRALREAVQALREILTSYEDRAVRDEDFAAFIEFQDRIANFTNDLPDDLPERETFEEIDDLLQKRRLVESDFETARERLATVEPTLQILEDWEDATERYREARRAVRRRLDEVRDEIADRERLQRLGEADLDAPVERLRDPIETYDAAVREAFIEFKADAPARDVLDLLATARHYPLVPFGNPPEDLRAFAERHEVGAEPIPQLVEYAGFSRSKLDHYVADPDALKRAVATQQTFLERLDATPLTVEWPPPQADVLRWQCDERISVVGRFAPDAVADLRTVRDLTRREAYDHLRDSALARDQLTDGERERLRTGTVEEELAQLREERERLEDALETYPDR
jgi:hypothetical protein